MSTIRTAKVLVVATLAATVTVDSDRLYRLYSSSDNSNKKPEQVDHTSELQPFSTVTVRA